MTDRIHSLVVTLDRDMRTDDVEGLIDAISWMKHVINVEGNVADYTFHAAETRVRFELGQELWKVIHPKPDSAK